MRKVAMYGARFIRSEYPDVKVFRVCRWKFTPKSLVLNSGEGETVREDESGAWNLDGEILPQPPNKSLTFRFFFGFLKSFWGFPLYRSIFLFSFSPKYYKMVKYSMFQP